MNWAPTFIFGLAALFSSSLGQSTPQNSLDDIENKPPPGALRLWSAFNPEYVDHVYSTNKTEVEILMLYYGFHQEGPEGTSTGYIYTSRQPDSTPLYRLFSIGLGDHLYTTFVKERDVSIQRHGYTFECIIGYLLTSDGPGRVPLYRLHDHGRHDHYYTTSPHEREEATRHGWVDEGIAGYLLC